MKAPRDFMRGILTLLLVGGFMAALAALFRYVVPDGNRDLVNFMLGQLSIMASAAVGYHIGTSKSSADKSEVIRGLSDGPEALPSPRPAGDGM